jgi:hypothetical protein
MFMNVYIYLSNREEGCRAYAESFFRQLMFLNAKSDGVTFKEA